MIQNSKLAAIAMPLALSLALAACGSPEAQSEGQMEAAMTEEPGVDGQPVTQGQAQSEAQALSQRLASGDLDRAETAVALEDLDRLINDNPVDFPEDMRLGLAEDIQSARTALETDDLSGVQDAAASIETKLSAAAPTGETD